MSYRSKKINRELRPDFTQHTLAHIRTANKRAQKREVLNNITQGFSTMQKKSILRTIPGAALAVAIIATGGAGVYAATSWFNANITTKRDKQTIIVEADNCSSFEKLYTYERAGFQIKDPSKIDEQQLKDSIMANCEAYAAREFLAVRLSDEFSYYRGENDPNRKSGKENRAVERTTHPFIGEAKVLSTTTDSVTLQIATARNPKAVFTYAIHDALIFDKGIDANLSSLKAGDLIEIALLTSADAPDILPSDEIKISSSSTIEGIFKTQYGFNDLEIFHAMPQYTERVGFGRHIWDAEKQKAVPADDKTTIH